MNDCIRCDKTIDKLIVDGVKYTNYVGGVDVLFVVEHTGMLKRNQQYKVKYGVVCEKCFNKIKDRLLHPEDLEQRLEEEVVVDTKWKEWDSSEV